MLKDLDNISKEKYYVGILTLIQIFNLLDVVIILPLAPTFMRVYQITPAEFSLLASSYNISAAITAFLYSSIAEKYNRKNFLTFLIIGLATSTTLCGFAPNYHFLLFARLIAGVFGGVINPVVYAIVADLIPEKRRGKAVGTILASFSITSVLGIPTGLAIADYIGFRFTFFTIGIGSILACFFHLKLLPSIPVSGQKEKVGRSLLNLAKFILKKEYILPYSIISLFTFSGFMIFPFLSPYIVHNIGLTEADLKYIYFVGGLFTIFAARFTGKYTDRHGELKAFLPAKLLSIPFVLLYTSIGKTPFHFVILISTCFMVFINARFIPVMTMITKFPKENERGAFMGLLLSLRSLSSALAISFSGVIITELPSKELAHFDKIGYISVTLSIIGSILVYKLYRKMNNVQNRSY